MTYLKKYNSQVIDIGQKDIVALIIFMQDKDIWGETVSNLISESLRNP